MKQKPIKECTKSRLKAYKGLREPKCNGGRGCPACWVKYQQVQFKMRTKEYCASIG